MKSELLIILAASVTNIMLNTKIKQIAVETNGNLVAALSSGKILVPFLIGMLSLFLLLSVYCSGVNLAKGILLMGATSIICGTLYAVFFKGNTLTLVEWLIFTAILAFYTVKWVLQIRQA